MAENRLEARLASMQTCMEIAKMLDDSPHHLVPTPAGASPVDVQATVDRFRLSRKKIAHMLNAIVLEIGIKVIWELDHNAQPRHTHDVSSLYHQLAERSQKELKAIYDEKSTILADLQGTDRQGQHIRIGDLIRLQSLQEALDANEDTMKNFKYDGVFEGKSSAMGSAIWDKQTLWVLPRLDHKRIPEALYQYAVGRVEEVNRNAS